MTAITAKPGQAAYEHNGHSVSPQAFYAIACDPRRSVAVEACAGAGKTWMLVSRIVRALLDGIDPDSGQFSVQPHEILAITFTKRAASEMRERLYQWLQEFSVATPEQRLQALRDRGVTLPSDPLAQQALSTRLAQLYASLLDNGRQVQIRTFHSWFAALLRSAPLNLLQHMQLPANYELLEDDAPAKALVWRRFYAALLADDKALAEDADVTQPSPVSLKADYQAVVLAYGRSQTDKALQTALDKRTEFALADAHGVVDTSVLHFNQQFPDCANLQEPDDYLSTHPLRWQVLLDAARALGAASARTFAAKGVELEAALTGRDLDAAFAALMTGDGEPRKFSDKVAGLAQVRQAQDLVLRVLAVRAQHQAWLYQQRMARLSRLLLAEFAALKHERGWVDMNDVERAAQRMLSDNQLSGWVQERLDARVKHLLIDEFQDTNPLQWQALRAWLSGYAGAGGQAPSVFMVGDPKQSIYRFRRAEPQVFKAAQLFVREGLGGDLLSCDHTRRNAPQVIATVNAVMQDALQNDGYEGFRTHTTDATVTGQVHKLPPIARLASSDQEASDGSAAPSGWRDSLTTPREVPEETLRTLEARQAAAWIASQLRGAPQGGSLAPKDVMVLSRKRAGLLPLQSELRQLNIAAQIGEKTDLIDCCEVQDVVALLDVLVSPQHDLSLARVLKSPIFGLSDEALVQLALAQRAAPAASTTPATWFELLAQVDLRSPRGQDVAACLTRWKSWLDSLPPHDALQAMYTDADLLAHFASAAPATQREAVLVNLRALLGVALQTGGGRFATPYAFVRALKSGGVLAPAAVNPEAVRLLTIHGAKGLEAPLVLLLDTDTPERNADTMGVLVDWPGEAAWPSKFVFLASESQPPACAQATLATELRERQREELNTLYVALTRARQSLVISSIEPYRAAQRSWWQRLQALADAVVVTPPTASTPSPALDAVTAPAPATFALKELPPAPARAAPSATASESSAATPELAVDEALDLESRLGLAMHRLLEWGLVSVVNTSAAAQEFGLSPSQGQQAASMAQGILQGQGAWAWQADVVGWAGNEVSLYYQGETLRLDRLVQRRDGPHAGHWWVLDYKSALAPQRQRALVQQLRHYQAAVQTLYPQDLVKAAFLTPQGAVIELSDAPAEFE